MIASNNSVRMFEVNAIPAFRDNYIWGLSQGNLAAVVDPGDAEPVLAWLAQYQLELVTILITHHHQDHQGGVAQLLGHFPKIPVFGPSAESITGLTRGLSGGESIEVLGQTLKVFSVPGHTRGHLAYLAKDALFCGDTLFGAGCGRLFEGTPEQMAASLAKISALSDDTLIYCAHEYTLTNLSFAELVEPDNPNVQDRIRMSRALRERGEYTIPSSLTLERATNPFLRCSVPSVIRSARKRNPDAVDPVSVFATLRAWRDEF